MTAVRPPRRDPLAAKCGCRPPTTQRIGGLRGNVCPIGYLPDCDGWICDHGAVWQVIRLVGHGYNQWERIYFLSAWFMRRRARALAREDAADHV